MRNAPVHGVRVPFALVNIGFIAARSHFAFAVDVVEHGGGLRPGRRRGGLELPRVADAIHDAVRLCEVDGVIEPLARVHVGKCGSAEPLKRFDRSTRVDRTVASADVGTVVLGVAYGRCGGVHRVAGVVDRGDGLGGKQEGEKNRDNRRRHRGAAGLGVAPRSIGRGDQQTGGTDVFLLVVVGPVAVRVVGIECRYRHAFVEVGRVYVVGSLPLPPEHTVTMPAFFAETMALRRASSFRQ